MFLDSLVGLFSSDMAIDLGTANTLVLYYAEHSGNLLYYDCYD